MKCAYCGYYWQDEDADYPYDYPYCHYVGPNGWAPCEQEDNNEPEDYNPIE